MDLWSQIYLLDSGKTLGPNITAYRKKYFDNLNTGSRNFNQWTLKPGADKQIHSAIAPMVIRFDESTFAELPPLVFNKVKVSLPEKALNYYRDIEKEFFAEMDGAETVVESSTGKYLVCRQIANGRHYDPDDGDKD